MKLELKHLAPYLPYGLDMLYESIFEEKPFNSIDKLETHNIGMCLVGGFKPILRPLSDLTKWGIDDLFKIKDYKEMTYEDVRWMFELHFDVFGLIEKGLAIDINTLEK